MIEKTYLYFTDNEWYIANEKPHVAENEKYLIANGESMINRGIVKRWLNDRFEIEDNMIFELTTEIKPI